MAMFEFKCPECGLHFEKLVDDEDTEEIECESCEGTAEKSMSDFGFEFDSGRREDGPIGVDSVDNDVDKIIGRDADDRWEQVKDRQRRKRKVARNRAGYEQAPIKKDPKTQDYDVISEEEQWKNAWLHEQRVEYKEQTEESEEEEVDEESSQSE